MKTKYLFSALLFLFAFNVARAQEIAYTEDGTRVILYLNHTWEYVRGDERGVRIGSDNDAGMNAAIRHLVRDNTYYEILMKDEVSGANAEIIVDGVLRFILVKGHLAKWEYLPSHKYGRIRNTAASKYHVEYKPFDKIPVKIGPYDIEYEFSNGRVKKIGSHIIEYNFFNDRIKRIGNTYIEYGSFNDQIMDISGETPGLVIYLY